MNRQCKFISERDQHPALGGTVQFGHHQAGDIRHSLKHFDLVDRILPGCRIEDQDRIVRCIWIFLADHTNDF